MVLMAVLGSFMGISAAYFKGYRLTFLIPLVLLLLILTKQHRYH